MRPVPTSLPPTPWPEIRKSLGYDIAVDVKAAKVFAERVRRPPYHCATAWATLAHATHGKTVAIVGGSSSAPKELARVPAGVRLWTADGATAAAHGHPIDAVVTDLDGPIEPQVAACRGGAYALIHAHGDNAAPIDRFLERFPPLRVIGTCQVTPPPAPLLDHGGFTDGDRAVHLALAAGAAKVLLVGFDYDAPGPYSAKRAPERKKVKLAWTRRLIDALVAAGAPISHL